MDKQVSGIQTFRGLSSSQLHHSHHGGGGGRDAVPPGIVLGGVLGLFGLSKSEPTEEENLETTVKMAILAVQVKYILLFLDLTRPVRRVTWSKPTSCCTFPSSSPTICSTKQR